MVRSMSTGDERDLLADTSCGHTINMEARGRSKRLRGVIGFCVLLALTGIIYFGYFCPDHVCALTNRDIKESTKIASGLQEHNIFPTLDNLEDDRNSIFNAHPLFKFQSVQGSLGYEDVFNNDSFQFDVNAHDVMVFLHIQKTGGTLFGKHLVRDLDLQRPCSCHRRKKRCYCFRPNSDEHWLFSRYSTGWKCGLHADWTELTNCVDNELNKMESDTIKRRYFYLTIIRDPVARYLSEFRHVQRGATWKGSRHWCGGTLGNIPSCYNGPKWLGVTLEEFMACSTNLASNRQTRMLADLSLIGCYNSSLSHPERDYIMLESAKHNLQLMPFFMLTEYQKDSPVGARREEIRVNFLTLLSLPGIFHFLCPSRTDCADNGTSIPSRSDAHHDRISHKPNTPAVQDYQSIMSQNYVIISQLNPDNMIIRMKVEKWNKENQKPPKDILKQIPPIFIGSVPIGRSVSSCL